MLSSFRLVWDLFDRRMRKESALVLLMTIIGSITDGLSVAVILPVIQVAMDPAGASVHPVLGPIHDLLGITENNKFMAVVCAGLLLFFIIKNLVTASVIWVQNSFIARNRARMSSELVRGYLEEDYAFHLTRNSASLFRNAISAVIDLFSGTVSSLFTIITETLVAIAIIIVLLMAEPSSAMVAGIVIGLALFVFQRLLRRRMAAWGQQTYDANEDMIVRFNHAFGGIKETKVLGRERHFAHSFADAAGRHANLLKVFTMLNQSPRLVIEVMAVAGMLIAVLTILQQGRSPAEAIPVLGMFAMAAFRMMPSISRLTSALGNLHFNYALTRQLTDDIRACRAAQREDRDGASPLPFERDIRVEGLSFRYPGAAQSSLDGIDLHIRKGESVALIGASGSGKSTVANILLGLLRPESGKVLVDGQDIIEDPRRWQSRIGLVPEDVFLIDDTLRRNIAFGLLDEEIDEDRVRHALSMAQLDDLVTDLPLGLDTSMGERGVRLSGGQRQRVAIARCLYRDVDVILLDEATSALDAETEAAITTHINTLRGDKTLIIIAHRLSTVQHCDRLFLLDQGSLVDTGTFAELAERNPRFHEMVRQMDLSASLGVASVPTGVPS